MQTHYCVHTCMHVHSDDPTQRGVIIRCVVQEHVAAPGGGIITLGTLNLTSFSKGIVFDNHEFRLGDNLLMSDGTVVNLNRVVVAQEQGHGKWGTMLEVFPYRSFQEDTAAGRSICIKDTTIQCVAVSNVVTMATIAPISNGQYVYLKAKLPHVLRNPLPHVCVSVSPKLGDFCLLAVTESDQVAQAVSVGDKERLVCPAVIGAKDNTSKIFGECIQVAPGHHRFDRAKFKLFEAMDLSQDCRTRLGRRRIDKILIPYVHSYRGTHKREMLIHLGCVLDRVHAAPKKVTDIAGIPRDHIVILEYDPKRCIEEVVLRSKSVDEFINDKEWVSHLLRQRLEKKVLKRVRGFISCLAPADDA